MKKATLSLSSFLVLTFLTCLPVRADSVLTTITVGSGPAAVAANLKTNKIYVAVNGLKQVAVIDGKTQQVTARIDVGGNTVAVAVNVITDRIYATSCSFSSASCTIAVINGNNNKLITAIPINSGSSIGLQGLAVNPITNLIYASDADNGQYIVIDGRTNTIVTQVPVFNQPAGITVNPKTSRLYVVAGGFPGEVLVFDGATNAQLGTIPEDFGVGNIATNFLLDRAYVTQGVEGALVVIDGATNQNVTQVPTGESPQAVDVNLLNNKVYVANGGSSSVTIIDGKTNQILQTLPVPTAFPDGISVNQATGLTYVCDGGSDKVIVLQPN